MMEQHRTQALVDTATAKPAPEHLTTPPLQAGELTQGNGRTPSLIGWILRGGVIASAALTLLGLLLLPFRPGGLTDRQTVPHTLGAVWMGLLGLHPQALIALGLLLLIATPVVTVTTAALAFALERDRRFVVIALLVLAILLTSFLLGRNG